MLAHGHVAAAIESLDIQGRVHEVIGREARISAIAREHAASPENTLVVSPDNRSVPRSTSQFIESYRRKALLASGNI